MQNFCDGPYGWNEGFGVEVESRGRFRKSDYGIQIKGLHARALASTEVGTHLIVPKHGGPIPVRVNVVDEWPPNIADPFSFGPIVRIYPEGRAICDVRTGLMCPPPFSPEVFRTFTLAALPRS